MKNKAKSVIPDTASEMSNIAKSVGVSVVTLYRYKKGSRAKRILLRFICEGFRNYKRISEEVDAEIEAENAGWSYSLLDVPIKLICQRCEDAIKRQGGISSDELVGKHVHKGVASAKQTCCDNS